MHILALAINFILCTFSIMLWQPLVTTTNSDTINKSLSRVSSGDYKRTRQEVSAELLFYLYKLQMVCATNN